MTDGADLGFGSFYNHFATKRSCSTRPLPRCSSSRAGCWIGCPSGRGHRGGLRRQRPRHGRSRGQPRHRAILVRAGLNYLLASDGLAPQALRDVEPAVAAGRFDVATPFLWVVTTMGCPLAYLDVRLHAPDRLGHETADELAEHILHMRALSPPRRTTSPTGPCRGPRPRRRHNVAPDCEFP